MSAQSELAAYESATFENLLATHVAATPDRTAYYLDDTPITWAQLEGSTVSAANALLSVGVEPGNAVALFGMGCPEWLAVWLATPRIGALSVPVNIMFKGDWCASTNMPADANCSDAVALGAKFAASSVKINN